MTLLNALVLNALVPSILAAADSAAAPTTTTHVKNPAAVAEVLAGKRTEADASWWGFDRDDSTDALQSAINSGAKRVVVPNLGRDWIVRPIRLAGDQELIFEEGVVVAAKRGEYRGGGDTVFTASNVKNLAIRGQGRGATVRMNKRDYIYGLVFKDEGKKGGFGQYLKAEWRSVLALRGCSNVEVEGLALCSSGGDGIYIDRFNPSTPCRNVRIKNVVCDDNYRQGMSVIGAEGLTVENCIFKNTWGTAPSAGVDLEPDDSEHTLKDVVFRNCRFEDNYSVGILVYLAPLKKSSADVSIRFEDCRIASRFGGGVSVAGVNDDGPNGLVEFINCTVDGAQTYGLRIETKAAERARVRFTGCRLRYVAQDRNYHGAWTPIWLNAAAPDRVRRLGGIDFADCVVEDDRDRPVIEFTEKSPSGGLSDVTGTIRAATPAAPTVAKLGEKLHKVELQIDATAPKTPR